MKNHCRTGVENEEPGRNSDSEQSAVELHLASQQRMDGWLG